MRINNYNRDTNVVANDKWIGSDFNNNGETKNFTPTNLAAYYNHNQVIDSPYLKFTYQTLLPGEVRAEGTISFVSEIGPSVSFSSINTFLVSNKSLKGNTISQYLNFLNGGKIILSNGENINDFGFYKISNIQSYIPDPNFFTVTLQFISGNGSMLEDKDYIVSLLVDSQTVNSVVTRTSSLTNDGENGINPFISALALTPYLLSSTAASTYFPKPTGTISQYLRGDGSLATFPSITTQTLNQVLTAGNASLLDAKIGDLYLYDTSEINYGNLDLSDSEFRFFDVYGQAVGANRVGITFFGTLGSGFYGSIVLPSVTANRTYTLPNASGTIALTSDIPSLTGYVPYTGATNSVNIGVNSIIADNGVNNTEMSPSYFGVQNAASTTYGLLEFNQLTLVNPTSSMAMTAAGITFPNASLQVTAFPPIGGIASQYIKGDGTLATFPTIPSVTPSALTRVSDTNVTLTLGGTPNTALLQGVSLTLGWTGTLADSRITSASNWNTAYTNRIVSLTTTGSSGSASLISNTLNIPTYTLSGLGGVPTSRTLTINGTTYDLSADRSWTISTSTGTVTSVGLSMPSAFTVSSSPITTSGTIAVTGAGVASQYVRGDGTLANFPTSTGGGASVSYYLNGSVSQGTIGGVAYKEMNSVPVIGAGTDFSINADGYIAQFITDVGDPNKLLIPSGNWNFETYFSASSGGGTPRFYIELYKYNGTTFTLIASNSTSPRLITDGTNIEAYFSVLAVPATTLLVTDRLAVRFYVIHSGRTITMHTENSHLSQVITTFSSGLTALNGLTSQVQYFAVGTSGTDFNISSATDTHTFNLPTASATNRGALSSANWSTFNNKQDTINLTTTGSSGASTFISNTLNVPTYTLSGLGGQPLATNLTSLSGLTFASTSFVKMTAAGTFSLDTNTYLTSAVTSVSALTLGTTGTDLSSTVANGTTTPVITLNVPTASATNRGALSSTDWSTFNGKQNAITLTTTGTSGPATLVGATLNIPQYSGGGGGSTPVKLTSQTLAVGSWTLVGIYYTYAFSNVNVTTTSDVSVTPQNASYLTAYNAQVLPFVGVSAGVATFYSQFPPQDNMIVDIVITQTT